MTIFKALAIFSLGLISFCAFSQWNVKPVTPGHPISDIVMIDGNTGYIAGGTVISKTVDGGINWQPLVMPTLFMGDHHLNFLDANTGYTVGWENNNEVILKTTNGGTTWNIQHSVNPDNSPFQPLELRLRDIALVGTNMAITVGYRGRILKTSDGGQHWNAITVATDKNLEAVQFITSSVGIAAGDRVVLVTTDGGNSWAVNTMDYGISDIYFSDLQHGIATTREGIILTTIDGGVNWTANHYRHPSSLDKISFVTSQVGFIVGGNTLLKTVDGGNHFEKYVFEDQEIESIQARSEDNILMTTARGNLISNNGSAVDFYPIADFDKTRTSICFNQNLNLTNYGPETNTYSWYVDNEQISTDFNLEYTLPTAGNHVIKLVANNGVKRDSTTHPIQVIDLPPLPDYQLNASTQGCGSYNVWIYVNGASPGQVFDLYDGNTVIGTVNNNPKMLTFYDSVTLMIHTQATNSCGTRYGEESVQVNIVKIPAHEREIVSDAYLLCPGDSTFVEIKNSESGIMYVLNEVESTASGNVYHQVGDFKPGNGGSLKFSTPPILGFNRFMLSAKDMRECMYNYDLSIQIIDLRKFSVNFEIDSLYVLLGHAVQFKNLSDADAYEWDFGEGTSSQLQTPEPVTYATPGEKTITLKALVSEGCSKSMTAKINVMTEVTSASLNSLTLSDHFLTDAYHVTDFKKVNGSFFVTGYKVPDAEELNEYSKKFFIARYHTDGTLIWMRTREETDDENTYSTSGTFSMDDEENIYVTGTFTGPAFTIADRTFQASTVEPNDPLLKGIILKLDRNGHVLWSTILDKDQGEESITNRINPSDIKLDGGILYINILKPNYQFHWSGIHSSGTQHSLETDNFGNLAIILKLDTAGNYIEHIEYGIGLAVPVFESVSYNPFPVVNSSSHGPKLSVENQRITLTGSYVVNQSPWGRLYMDRTYEQSLQSIPYSINGFLAVYTPAGWSNMQHTTNTYHQEYSIYGIATHHNGNVTDLDTHAGQRYVIVTQQEWVAPSTPGTTRDSIRFVDGGFLFCYDENDNLLWKNFLPYAELIGIQVINSDIYLVGNFNKRVGAESQDGSLKAIQSQDERSTFLAKYSPAGNLQWISDVGISPGINEFIYSITKDDCANDLTLLIADEDATKMVSISLDNTVTPCFKAHFKANQRSVVVGSAAKFTDLSYGSQISSWSWTFEGADISSSTDQNPSGIVYQTPGAYTVSLTVNGPDGEQDTHTISEYILVEPLITPDFSASPLSIRAGESIDFQDLTQGTPTTWNWSFEGAQATTSTLRHPGQITYLNPGRFDVSLNVKTAAQSHTKTIADFITVLAALTADFNTTSTSIAEGDAIDFTDLSTGDPAEWLWSSPVPKLLSQRINILKPYVT